jgi:hypothetical protein
MRDALDHHDGRVHDDAEVDGPDAEQAQGDICETHTDEREEQGQRDDQGGEERRSRAEQEYQQHRDHDHEPFEHDARYRPKRVPDERGSVVDRHHADPGRESTSIELVDRTVDGV